ncbi:bifunctional lysylphosphatidylglycerol flippase/synthetase MprF [Arthrobacter sp. NA-172]|uniref:bifunctional lysylphosphatidylglycerol flippase/synthetase MprF n=1 Tax=Arthrobacter sp. NA-172 TaxID=3367524 RepID=UPI0037543DBD
MHLPAPEPGTLPVPDPRSRRSWAERLRSAQLTLGFVVLFWGLGALTSSLSAGPDAQLRLSVAATPHSVPDHWWAIGASALWARDLPDYVLGTVLVLLLGVPLERRMGRRAFAIAAVSSQILGVGVSLGFLAAAQGLLGSWIAEIGSHLFMGPSAFIIGTAMAGTASMPTLWRRRTRLAGFALLLLLALYSGGFADLVRLGAAGVGTVLGPLLMGRRPRFGRPVSSRHEGRVLLSLLIAASAIGPVVAGLIPHAVGPLSILRFLFTNIQPIDAQTLQALCSDPSQAKDCAVAQLQLRAGAGGIFMAILPSFLLLLLADGLRRGRRFAWVCTVVIQVGLSVLAGIALAGVLQLTGSGTGASEGIAAIEGSASSQPFTLAIPLLLPVALTIVLLSTRKLFHVKAPDGTYRRLVVRILLIAGVLSVVYVTAGFFLAQGFSPAPGLPELLADVPDRFLPLGFVLDAPPAFFPESTAAVLVYEGVGVVFWAITGFLIFRTFLHQAHSRHDASTERARKVIKTSEGSSLSWMTTWPGNMYWFSASGRSFVAYRVNTGVALTLGGPVGPKAEMNAVFEEFADYCRGNGWTPCFYSVPQDLRDHADSFGWSSAQVAQETVLPLHSVSFKGKKFQDIRTALNNAAKAGIRYEWTSYAKAPFSVLVQIEEISEEWVADKNMPEMGFTLGSLDELDDPDVRCLLAIDRRHTVHAVTSWLPVYRNGHIVGWTLDFMRRRSNGFRASIEFLLASAALSLKDEGCEFISLSGAPLARIAEDPEEMPRPRARSRPPGNLDRLLDWLGATLEPVYGFRSLLAFKAKFRPRYEPLYMLYPDAASLPAVGTAVARAYLPMLNLGAGLALAGRIFRRSKRSDEPARRP